MEELEPGGDGSIGPLEGSGLPQESMMSNQAVKVASHVVERDVRARCDGGCREDGPRDARDLQQASFCWVQAIDLPLDHSSDVIGDPELGTTQVAAHGPFAVPFDKQATPDQITQNVDHEQRIATGVLVDQSCQSRLGVHRTWRGRKAELDVFDDGALVETAEGDLGAEALDPESVGQRGKGMIRPSNFRSPVGGDQQHARPLGTLRKRRDPVERRDIAPVQVFEPQDQRKACGHRFSGVGELTEHRARASPPRPCAEAGCVWRAAAGPAAAPARSERTAAGPRRIRRRQAGSTARVSASRSG